MKLINLDWTSLIRQFYQGSFSLGLSSSFYIAWSSLFSSFFCSECFNRKWRFKLTNVPYFLLQASHFELKNKIHYTSWWFVLKFFEFSSFFYIWFFFLKLPLCFKAHRFFSIKKQFNFSIEKLDFMEDWLNYEIWKIMVGSGSWMIGYFGHQNLFCFGLFGDFFFFLALISNWLAIPLLAF